MGFQVGEGEFNDTASLLAMLLAHFGLHPCLEFGNVLFSIQAFDRTSGLRIATALGTQRTSLTMDCRTSILGLPEAFAVATANRVAFRDFQLEALRASIGLILG